MMVYMYGAYRHIIDTELMFKEADINTKKGQQVLFITPFCCQGAVILYEVNSWARPYMFPLPQETIGKAGMTESSSAYLTPLAFGFVSISTQSLTKGLFIEQNNYFSLSL